MPRRSAAGWRNRCSRRAPPRSPRSIRYNDPMTARASIDTRPLAGRRVVITRAAAQASAFARLLSAAGADVLEAPTIAIGPPDSWGPLGAALERGEVDVVTFTSSSTALSFAALFTDEERARLLAGVTIASIGPITAATAASVGLATRVMPDEYTIPALARAIVAHFASG